MLHACSKTRDSVALASRPRLDFEYALLPGALSHPYTWGHVFVTVSYDCSVARELRESEREGHPGGEGLVMSGERADNRALLDYTDLFGPAERCKSLLKTSNCRLRPFRRDPRRTRQVLPVRRSSLLGGCRRKLAHICALEVSPWVIRDLSSARLIRMSSD